MTISIRTYFNMVTVPHEMIKSERMLDFRGVKLELYRGFTVCIYIGWSERIVGNCALVPHLYQPFG